LPTTVLHPAECRVATPIYNPSNPEIRDILAQNATILPHHPHYFHFPWNNSLKLDNRKVVGHRLLFQPHSKPQTPLITRL
jgi:hypothetical protein